MNTRFEKYYYLVRGDWYNIFSQLLGIIPACSQKKFAIWEPADKSKEYLVIIVYGVPLTDEYCFSNKIWKTHEKIFDAFYLPKIQEYKIHSNTGPAIEADNEFTFPSSALRSTTISHPANIFDY